MNKRTGSSTAGLLLVASLVGCGGSSPSAETPTGSPEGQPSQDAGAGVARPPSDGTADAPEARSEQDAATSASRVPRTPPPGSPINEMMAVHFQDAELIRTAVIAGRPEGSGRPAESLLQLYDVADAPETWREPLKRMRLSAQRVKDSSDIAGVAAATADIGTSCGWCHQQLGGPALTMGEPPRDEGSLATRMKRHVWATERLWEGLYLPSSVAWEKGSDLLVEAPFPTEVLARGGVYARTAAADFSRIAAVAPTKLTQAERAALYAELLGTCASCHIAMQK